MDPIIDSDWLMNKSEPIEDSHSGNIARSWVWRERGINPTNSLSNKTVLENVAEDILVQKPLKIRCCDLPGYPRSTFLMVFSPDGTKVASAHGNHNVYVSELASGKHVRILKGHPRTPWCIAFHPSHPELIGSGCLGGQVRVWDIASGGSEVWSVQKETVIASIAFHPREQLLVIATSNELYFWDWSQPAPFTKVSTDNINEKVRYVAFDSLGYKLITGISLYNVPPCATNVSEQNAHPTPPPPNYRRRQEPEENTPNNRSLDSTGPTGDVIVNSYQNLVQRYDSLVRNYQRLFLVRHRLTATTPPPSTTDRGTDPMETDSTGDANARYRSARRSLLLNIDDDSTPSTSTTNESTDNNDVDPLSRSRLLSLDALTLERGSLRTRSLSTGRQESSVFGSRPSAFQPLNESSRPSLWQARPLPSHVTPPRRTLAASVFNQENTGSSRTSVFPAYRSATPPIPPPVFLPTSFNNSISDSVDAIFPTENSVQIDYSTPSSPDVNSPIQVVYGDFPPEASNNASTSGTNTDTQPTANPRVDAQAINESLDLIRDILRDSGTRLLNLITNMSLSNLSRERRRERSRAHSDGDGSSDGTSRSRNARTRPRLFSSGLPNSLFLSSSSESDSDNPPEVNIFRTRNASFREDAPRNSNRQTASGSARPEHPIPLVLELNDELVLEENFELGGFNVSPNPRSFHVRSRNSTEESTSTRTDEEPRENRTRSSSFDPNVPSTSRQTDSLWSGGNSLTSQEAFRKVRGGVNALQKHVQQLTNFWVRGQRISMRDLRNMWENLRRRILILHRETGRQDVPSYYSRSLLERCMMLSAVSENISRSSSRTRGNPRAEDRNAERAREQAPLGTGDNEQSLTSGSPSTSRQNRNQQPRSSTAGRYSSFARRRLQPNHRWRHEDELRRRARNPTSNRLSPRLSRPRRELARAIEISATRHEIRMRAMQVLSVMFNMMMMCLEEPGLSQLIINMLRTLKKALALTCLMLMSNRNSGRGNGNTNQTSQQSDNRNSVNTELNTDSYANDTNTSESMQNSISSETEEDRAREGTSNSTENIISPTMLPKPSTSFAQDTPSSSPSTSTETWSNRLAVQIAAANRNTSAIARSRRDLYLESRRLKALHRTNPIKHPLIKKRLPPMSNHRIPSLRALPRKIIKRSTLPAPRDPLPPIVPEAMPRRRPFGENANGEPSRLPPEVMNEFEHRINLIRIAHMQAVRLRNAARNRYRRLQTIRFYAPPAMREMFSLSGDNDQNQQGARSGTSENRPAMLNRERLVARVPINIDSEDMNEIHAGEALLQVNDAVNAEGQSPQARMPRIHEYLQPIILAQNAVVVEDDDENNGEGNGFAGFGVRRVGMGGMAGLLDASLTSDNFPIPSHRIQAWDFTNRDAPNIADDEKNIVVQRCRIHNDASIDISKDGRLLVALLPVPRLRNTTHWLGKIGVYSLEWPRLGHCLHTAVLEQSAVSVALSPTGRHLAVGLGSRRFTSVHHARSNVFALLFRLDPPDGTSRTGLSPIKELEQTWEHGFTSLNCLRWAPQPGQGLVYANNTGQLIIMS